MKYLTILLVFIASHSYSQDTYKLNVRRTCISMYDYSTQQWEEWSKWEPNTMLIVINVPQGDGLTTFTIYSKTKQSFTAYKPAVESVTSKADVSLWYVVDEKGQECTIKINNYFDNSYNQIIVERDDYALAYELE